MKVRDVSGFFSSISLCDMILLFVCLVVVCFWKNLQKKMQEKKKSSQNVCISSVLNYCKCDTTRILFFSHNLFTLVMWQSSLVSTGCLFIEALIPWTKSFSFRVLVQAITIGYMAFQWHHIVILAVFICCSAPARGAVKLQLKYFTSVKSKILLVIADAVPREKTWTFWFEQSDVIRLALN